MVAFYQAVCAVSLSEFNDPPSTTTTDLLVLVGGDGDEFGLLEDVGPEGGVRQLEDVVGPDQMKPWLVLVHRV